MSLLDNNLINTYKTMIGLINVDNTTDLNKPISTATQTALNNKLNLTGGTLTGGLTGTTANFSGDVTANGISISSLNSSKLNLTGGTLVGGLTGTTASFSGPLIVNGGLTGTNATFTGSISANGGLTGTTATFSGSLIANSGITGTTASFSSLAVNGGLTGTTATFSGPLIANSGITGTTASFSALLSASGGLTGTTATFSGPIIANSGIMGTTGSFSGRLVSNGGLIGTTATFSSLLIANGGITGTTGNFSGDLTANGISISSLNSGKLNLTGGTLVGGLTGTTASFSGPLIANGGITGTTASFSGLLRANGSLTGTTANFSGDVTANGISISSLNSNKLDLTGGTLTGTITVPQITDLTLNNNTVATTSFVTSKTSAIKLKLPVDLISRTNQTLVSGSWISGIDSVVPAVNNRILFVNQNISTENGIYVVINSSTLDRASDFPLGYAANGTNVFVRSGRQYANTNWVCTNLTGSDIVGTDNLVFDPIKTASFSDPLIANGGITGSSANFSGIVAFNGGLTGSTATFSGPLIANGGITGTTANFSGSLIANGGLTGTTATFSGPLIANGGITGTTGSFSGLLTANGGLTGTTATFSGLLRANGGITGTIATFSGDVTANGISISSLNTGKLNLTGGTLVGGLTGTTASFSGPLIANGGITATTASFSGLLRANGGLTGSTANFSGDVTANGISISSLNSNKLNLTGGSLTGAITVPQITDLTLNNNTVATTSFVNSKVSAVPLKLPVDLVSTSNKTLTSTTYTYNTYNYEISSGAFYINSTDFAFGTGNFTCEAWINVTNYNNAFSCTVIFDFRIGSNVPDGFALTMSNSGMLGYYHPNVNILNSNVQVSLNTLTHIAYQRVGDVLQLYVNGIYQGQLGFNYNPSYNQSVYICTHNGTDGTTNDYKFKGFINNIRITKAAVYSGNFIPSQTLSALANTILLITNTNNVVDTSGTNKTITITGTITYNLLGTGTGTTAGTWATSIDSVVPAINNRILFVGQTDKKENGIYVVTNLTTLNRASDFPSGYAANGTNVFVKSGTEYANTNWVCINLTNLDIVGTHELLFSSIKTATVSEPLITIGGIMSTSANFSSNLTILGKIFCNLPNYTDNTAAKNAGLAVGTFYRTNEFIKIVQP